IQFLNSPWGYGGSAGLQSGLSFQIGKVHLGFLLLALGLLILHIGKVKEKKYSLLFLFFILFLISLFFQTTYSQFIWDRVQPFWYIQFPWRFLGLTTFFVSFLGGAIVLYQLPKSILTGFVALAILGAIIFNSKYFKPSSYLTSVNDQSYTSEKQLKWYTTKLSFEYVPKGIATYKSAIGNTQVDITE